MISFKSSDKSNRLDWYVRRGSDSALLLTLTDSNGAYNSDGIIFTVAVRNGNNITVLTPTVNNGGVTGLVTLSLTNTQTDIAGDEFFWSVLLTNAIGQDIMFLNGKFILNDYLWDSENENQNVTDYTIIL